MTHRWAIPDGCWLSDSRWICTRCGADAQFYVDTRNAPACRGQWWPWPVARRAAFTARIRRLHATP